MTERMGRRGVRRGELTPEEISSAAAEAEASGFSRRMTGTGVGRPARDVLSTGFSPEQGRGAEVGIDKTKSTASQLAQFIKNKASTWAVRGANWAVGGWVDNGEVKLDTSVLTPRTTGGTAAALQMGSYGDQEAVGNVGKKDYEGDIDIPSHLSRTQFYRSRGLPIPTNEGIEPITSREIVESTNPNTGQPQMRERVKIEPSRKEQVAVEADIIAKKYGFPQD